MYICQFTNFKHFIFKITKAKKELLWGFFFRFCYFVRQSYGGLFLAIMTFKANKSYRLVRHGINQSVFIRNSARKIPLQIMFEWFRFPPSFKWSPPDFLNHFSNFEEYFLSSVAHSMNSSNAFGSNRMFLDEFIELLWCKRNNISCFY